MTSALSGAKVWLFVGGALATPGLIALLMWFIKSHVKRTEDSIAEVGKKVDAQAASYKTEYTERTKSFSDLQGEMRKEVHIMKETMVNIKKEVNDELYTMKSAVQEMRGQSESIKYQAGQIVTFMDTTGKEVKYQKEQIENLAQTAAKHQKALEAYRLIVSSFKEQIKKLEDQMRESGMSKEEIEHRLDEMTQTFIKFGRTGSDNGQ